MADLPSRDDILKFVAEQTGKVGKREIARAFRLSGSDRIALKKLLREMAAEGLLEGARKSGMRVQGDLPNVCVIRVTGRDGENNLVARAIREGAVLDKPDAPLVTIIEPGGRGRVNRSAQLVSPGDTALARLARVNKNRYEASIIRKLGGAQAQIIGVIRHRPDGAWVVPVSRQERYEYRAREGADGLEEDTLVKAEKTSSARNGNATVKIVEAFGSTASPHAFSLIAIAEQNLPIDFPEAALIQAKETKPDTIDKSARADLCDIPFVTIDPADARDHDDAVYAEPDIDPGNQGGYVVWVAIADVAAYVTPDSAMDKEARKRGNSVYMPDRVVPMLPERLSNDLCSLREHRDRPCMAVRMQIDAKGKKRGHKFVRGMMRSAAKLSYLQAQGIFDAQTVAGSENPSNGTSERAGLDDILGALWQAYQLMAQARDARAPLIIDKPERRIDMNEQGAISRIYIPPRLEAHRLIEEMMIAANVCAAETLETRQVPLLFRVHDAPPPERMHALADFIKPLGARLDLGQPVVPALFNRIMVKAHDSEHYPTISEAVLRTQSQAVYTPENIGHFGLNLGRYAHFTSPIRRYADLIVHRALIRALKLGKDGLTDAEIEELSAIAEAVSATERRAMIAERAAADRYLSAFMSNQIGECFNGQISGVSRAGLFVKLDVTGADGLVPISRLGAERFFVDDDKLSLVGGTTGTVFRIGQPVEIRLMEATPLQGGLLFSLEDYASFPNSKGRKIRRGPATSRRPHANKRRKNSRKTGRRK